MAEQIDVRAELKAATDRVLASKSRKKLVVAGPGSGKTYLFRELLNAADGSPEQRLTLTFINTLKHDLERNLGDASRVFTLHGYCQYILRRNENLRNGLSAQFRCYPGLRSLIPQDWVFLHDSDTPHFIDLMRGLNCTHDQTSFYLDRTNYYDAVDFDDSVYRAYQQLAADNTHVPAYTLVLVDEFQDFNKMEASVIDLLAQRSPIVIAGDDDQALYSQLRSASWDHIRAHHANGEYEIFELPFCMRCPEVIVGAVSLPRSGRLRPVAVREALSVLGFIHLGPRYPFPLPPPIPASVYGHLPFRGIASGTDVFYRYEAYPTSRRIDLTTSSVIQPNTFASPKLDSAFVNSGLCAVARYALPQLLPARWQYELKPPPGTVVHYGASVPLYGQSGGGVEVSFPSTFKNNGAIPPPHVLPIF